MSSYRPSLFDNLTPVVKNLLIINVIFFAATYILQQAHIDLIEHLSAFYFDSPFFRPWQIITYMFMHSGLWHILGNMVALFLFGPTLEQTMGSKRFFNFYFICGIGALLCNMVVQAIEVHHITNSFTVSDWNAFDGSPALITLHEIYGSPILGASGAIFGILIAFGLLYPNVELMMIMFPIPIKAKYFISGYVLFELFSSIKQTPGDSVAHYAHLGGALFGFIMIRIWGLSRRDNIF